MSNHRDTRRCLNISRPIERAGIFELFFKGLCLKKTIPPVGHPSSFEHILIHIFATVATPLLSQGGDSLIAVRGDQTGVVPAK